MMMLDKFSILEVADFINVASKKIAKKRKITYEKAFFIVIKDIDAILKKEMMTNE
ncbi:MAG: hypothetical protein R3Y64_10665 [Peptostreptococcaceae bacterium]